MKFDEMEAMAIGDAAAKEAVIAGGLTGDEVPFISAFVTVCHLCAKSAELAP